MENYNSNYEIDILKAIIVLKLIECVVKGLIYYIKIKKRYKEKKIKNKKTCSSNINMVKKVSKSKINKNCDKSEILKPQNCVAKVPVILLEKSVEIPLEYTIKLDEYMSEVKDIKNTIYSLNTSSIFVNPREGKEKSVRLFIDGFIKNDIEYKSLVKEERDSLSGELKYVTSFIPFKRVAIVNFKSSEIMSKAKLDTIYCNIKKAKFFGTSNYLGEKFLDKNKFVPKGFNIIRERIILKLTLSLIQKQIINIYYNNKSIE